MKLYIMCIKSSAQKLQGPNYMSGAAKTSKRDSSRPIGPLNSFNYIKLLVQSQLSPVTDVNSQACILTAH